MLGGHLPELLIVLVLALVVFGPKRLPEIGGSLGKSIRDFRGGLSNLEEDRASRSVREPVDHDQIPASPPESIA